MGSEASYRTLWSKEHWSRSTYDSTGRSPVLRGKDKTVVVAIAVQSLSRVRLFVTPLTEARQASLSITISQSLLKPTSIESVMPSSHLILCLALLLPSIFPSIRVFSSESPLHIRWPPSRGASASALFQDFRIDWFNLLAAQRTLKSLLQHHCSEASILMVQLSHPYMTTGKNT